MASLPDNPPISGPPTRSRPLRDVTIVVCSSCRGTDGSDARPRPGERLADAARALDCEPGIHIESVECLGNCKRRLSAAFVAPGCWTYIFGGLTLENAADLLDGARLMRESENGLMPWRGRPQCLKGGMVARVPPINNQKIE